jgi:hypothetical protein
MSAEITKMWSKMAKQLGIPRREQEIMAAAFKF